MDEARSSWNTVYHSKEGFECQITLRDEDEARLAQRASKMMASIAMSGGFPVRRKGFEVNDTIPEESGNNEQVSSEKQNKTYIDEYGVRRCNKRLNSGTICGNPVVEREGKYGPFWSCPNYREHAG